MKHRRQKNSYEKLRDEWYKKAADTGFKDIEDVNNDTLKTWSTKLFQNHHGESWEAKRAYYQMAENFLEDYKFDTELEKVVWTYHASGISYRDIAKILAKAGNKIKSKSPIYYIIKKLKNSMYAMYLMPKTEYRE